MVEYLLATNIVRQQFSSTAWLTKGCDFCTFSCWILWLLHGQVQKQREASSIALIHLVQIGGTREYAVHWAKWNQAKWFLVQFYIGDHYLSYFFERLHHYSDLQHAPNLYWNKIWCFLQLQCLVKDSNLQWSKLLFLGSFQQLYCLGFNFALSKMCITLDINPTTQFRLRLESRRVSLAFAQACLISSWTSGGGFWW